jgi:hypothetical protein
VTRVGLINYQTEFKNYDFNDSLQQNVQLRLKYNHVKIYGLITEVPLETSLIQP